VPDLVEGRTLRPVELGRGPIVREFLVTERNEVMRKAIRTDIKDYVRAAEGADWELFQSRRSGSFDHRAYLIAAFVAGKIAYKAAAHIAAAFSAHRGQGDAG